MKKKDKQKLINYAVNYYNKTFDRDYKPVYKNRRDIKSLLKEYPHSSMCDWSYCCYGLYTNCWQEPMFEGNWDMTQKDVDNAILNTFTPDLLRKCRNEGRMFYCEKDGLIHMIIVARDLTKDDYLICFSKEFVL